jgi:hypothetical protein
MSTTTLKLDWDARTMDLATQAIAKLVIELPVDGHEDDITALSQAMVDIQGYRAMVEAVKTGDPGNNITDATTMRMAAAVLRRRAHGLVWPLRAADLLEVTANDLHPLPQGVSYIDPRPPGG